MLNCYHDLHPLFEMLLLTKVLMKNTIQNIFDITTNTNEPTKDVVNLELLIFKRFQMDAKNIICPFEWWEKHESMFPIVESLAYQIFKIVGSQIEIIIIFP
jgi:hypothetical protein